MYLLRCLWLIVLVQKVSAFDNIIEELQTKINKNLFLILSSTLLIIITIPLYSNRNNQSNSPLGPIFNIRSSVRNLVDNMSQGYKYLRDSNRNSGFSSYNRNQSKLHKFVLKNGGLVGGISNDGNTCFMNSVIQSVASSKSLTNFIDSKIDGTAATDLRFTKGLKELIDQVNGEYGPSSKEFTTKYLLAKMPNGPKQRFFSGYSQEDAQEFYQLVMSSIEKEIYPKVETNNSEQKKLDKYVVPSDDMVMGLDSLGSIGKVYVPANQVDPNISPEDESKVMALDLLTPVDGISAERIGCLECGESSGIRYSVISGLGLNLPPSNEYYYELDKLLDEWIYPEIIDDVECNRCGLLQTVDYLQSQIDNADVNDLIKSRFKARIDDIHENLTHRHIEDEIYNKLSVKNKIKKSKKTKQIYLSRPAPLLSIHINRSVFDPNTYMIRKNNADVKFSTKLNLTNWIAESNDINMDARLKFRKQDDHKIDAVVSETQSQDIETEDVSSQESSSSTGEEITPVTSQDEETQPDNKLLYNLKAVISHYGTHNYGHYIAYRKYRGSWFRISDETVHVVNEEQVSSSQGTFMLFYEYDDGQVEELIQVEEDEEEEPEEPDSDDEENQLSQELRGQELDSDDSDELSDHDDEDSNVHTKNIQPMTTTIGSGEINENHDYRFGTEDLEEIRAFHM